MSVTYRLGVKAGLYRGTAGVDSVSGMDEVTKARDVTLTLDGDEINKTTRANGGFRSTVQGLKDITIEFSLNAAPDATVIAFRNAWIAGTVLALCALDAKKTVVGAEGPLGDFIITSFGRDESLEDIVVYNVTARLETYTDWEVIAAGS